MEKQINNRVEETIRNYKSEYFSSTQDNYINAFLLPLLKRINKNPWQTADVYYGGKYKNISGKKSNGISRISTDLFKLAKRGIIEYGYDKYGMIYYALKNTDVPDNIVLESESSSLIGIYEKYGQQVFEQEFNKITLKRKNN